LPDGLNEITITLPDLPDGLVEIVLTLPDVPGDPIIIDIIIPDQPELSLFDFGGAVTTPGDFVPPPVDDGTGVVLPIPGPGVPPIVPVAPVVPVPVDDVIIDIDESSYRSHLHPRLKWMIMKQP